MNVGKVTKEGQGQARRTVALTAVAALVAVGLAGVAPTASAAPCDEGDVTIHQPGGGLNDQVHVCFSIELTQDDVLVLRFNCGLNPCPPNPDRTPPDPETPPASEPPKPHDRPCTLHEDPCVPAVWSAVWWAAAVADQQAGWAINTTGDVEDWARDEASKLEDWGLGNAKEIEGWVHGAPWNPHLEDEPVPAATIKDQHYHLDPDAHEPALDLVCTVLFGQGSTWEDCEAFINDLVEAPCDGPESCIEVVVGLITQENSSTPGVDSTLGLIVETPEGSVFVPAAEIPG